MSYLLRLLRRSLRRFLAQQRHPVLDMGDMPILFANSFPKSGTHLLTQILSGFGRLGPVAVSGLPSVLTFEGESGRQREARAIQADLERLLPGDISYGHLHATPEALAALCSPAFASFFIYRDPRDVVVSHVFYVTDINNRHAHHDYYVNQLDSFEERLRVSIQGRPELEHPFPDIAERFAPYLAWLERPEVLSLRYEDLLTDATQALEAILGHAIERGFPEPANRMEALNALAESIDPQKSPTFRRGVSGGWKQHFTPEITRIFKDLGGDLLVRLGYEKDHNW